MENNDLHLHCLRWAAWRHTRRFYVRPNPANILARFQPASIGAAPDADLDCEMQFFDAAISAMRNDKDYLADIACFWSFYVKRERNIKRVAADMGIGRRTYYDRVRRAARAAYLMSIDIKDARLVARQGAELVETD